MKSKEKNKKNGKITVKNIIYFLIALIFLIYAIIFYELYFSKKVYATEETINKDLQNINISEANKINIDDIISQNTNDGQIEKYEVKEEILEYITKYKTNYNIPKGMVQVIQEGQEGVQEVTIKKIYQEEELLKEEQVSRKITKAPINKIIEIGGGNGNSNYKVAVGDTIYVIADSLSVMLEPDENSQKVATLLKNTELKVQAINGQWYNIKSGSIRGYVKAEGTTYLNDNSNDIANSNDENTDEKSADELKKSLNFNMLLNKPSGLSLEQFKKILKDDKDKNNIFANNAEYFYYIEKEYNINGVFVAAVGIHESAWGTSQIAKEKNNLFGYGAYDSSPYNSAYTFANYSESIDLLARVFVKYYLNPKGTSIYGGEKAIATYYNGATLTGVNTKYATDKNWANSVYKHMQYLYNKL